MKLFKLSFFFFLGAIFLFTGYKSQAFALDPYRPRCVGIQGKFVAKNWKGGPIQVGCVGDDGGDVSNPAQKCTGQVIQNVKPGQTFRLTKCSCWGSNKGCLKVGKELRLNPLNSQNRRTITIVKKIQDTSYFRNNQCRINDTSRVCGANGAHLTGNVRITCKVPTTPTPSRPVTPTPSVTPTPTPSPTISPTPSICPVPKTVTNVKVSCPNCFSQNSGSCVNHAPLIEAVGSTSKTAAAGEIMYFSFKVINKDISSCESRTFNLEADSSLPSGWDLTKTDIDLVLEPGESANVEARIQSSDTASSGEEGSATISASDGTGSSTGSSNGIEIKGEVQ